MTKKLSVSIGIPAYNEEQNIKQLLTALLRQKQDNFVLREIIVVSDGSTDGTVSLAESVEDNRIRVIGGKKRLGQQARQNQILKTYRGDVLVLVEADTMPANDFVISELVKPFIDGAVEDLGMTISERLAVSPQSWFEKIFWHGGELKNEIFRDWQDGGNLYTCGGHAFRALPRSLTSKLFWPDNVSEDAFLYLFIRQLRLRIQRQEKAQVYMRHVSTVRDRIRQCTKYVSGKRKLKYYFSVDLVQSEYSLPKTLVIKHIWRGIKINPFWTFLALLEMVLNRALVRRKGQFNSLYIPYRSSKNLSRLKLSPSRTDKQTMSVGIPAYNEEQNIKQLLRALLHQKQESFILEQIIVVSDGSTDQTEALVESVVDPRVKLIKLKNKGGVGLAQNVVFDNVNSDIVVLLDADVIPVGLNFLEDIIAPFAEDNNIGLVGADRITAQPTGWLEKFNAYGNDLRTQVFKRINKADNVYMCFGTARAFQKKFYKMLRWPAISSEDSYSYLKCQELGFKFKFAPAAQVLFRSPHTFKDHAKQSNRFRMGKAHLIKRFRPGFVREHYAIKFWPAASVLLMSVLIHPVLTSGYLVTTFAGRIYKRFRPVDSGHYEIAASTKRVVL